jgi:hypothetical protein
MVRSMAAHFIFGELFLILIPQSPFSKTSTYPVLSFLTNAFLILKFLPNIPSLLGLLPLILPALRVRTGRTLGVEGRDSPSCPQCCITCLGPYHCSMEPTEWMNIGKNL